MSLRDPRLSAELRRFRERTGRSGDQVARVLGWSPSKISRYELGRTGLNASAIRQLIQYYRASCGMPEGQARALLALTDQAQAASKNLDGYLGVIVLAGTVREWAPTAIPLLLQVPGYTEAILGSRQFINQTPPGDIRDITGAVAGWQARLSGDPPVMLRAVLGEPVLYQLTGSPGVMRAQLQHLDQAAGSEGTDIGLRILPYASGVMPGIPPFSYLEYPTEGELTAPASVITWELEGPEASGLPEKAAWKRFLAFGELWEAAEEPGPYLKRALAEQWAETGVLRR